MGLFSFFKRRAQLLRHGDMVRIKSHVTVAGPDGTVGTLKGDRVTVVGGGGTCSYLSEGTGERMTSVQDRAGAIFAVPTRVLSKPINA